MKLRARYLAATAATTIVASAVAVTAAIAQMDDADYAATLWDEMSHVSLVGPHAFGAVPYAREGQAHADTLVTLQGVLTVEGHTGVVIVKRSYNDEATRGQIIAEPMTNLANVTVMFQREDGYDPDNNNWFWAMYTPDGEVGMMGDMAAAGRAEGCIGCHAGAPGEDYIFLHDGLSMMQMFIEEGGMMMMEDGDAMMGDGDAMMGDEAPMEGGGGM